VIYTTKDEKGNFSTVEITAPKKAKANEEPVNHELRRQRCIAAGIPFDTVPPPTVRHTRRALLKASLPSRFGAPSDG
jgi:hypothetical protein